MNRQVNRFIQMVDMSSFCRSRTRGFSKTLCIFQLGELSTFLHIPLPSFLVFLAGGGSAHKLVRENSGLTVCIRHSHGGLYHGTDKESSPIFEVGCRSRGPRCAAEWNFCKYIVGSNCIISFLLKLFVLFFLLGCF